jgi:hypothetical protein
MSRPQTPEDQKIIMNEDIVDTPQSEREKQRRAMLGQNRGDNRPSASMYSAARYIQQVNNLPSTQRRSQANVDLGKVFDKEDENPKPSDNTGGGILEMFGLAGGRRRRRKSRRKSRRRRKRTKKKRRRKSRRKRKRSRRRRRRK